MSKPHILFEVTNRCIQQRFLLRPSKRLNALVLGVLGMALRRHPEIRLYVFNIASNHYHIILSAPNHDELSRFMCYLNTNLAKEAGRLHGWRGPFWEKRYTATEIKDPEAMVQRLAYVLSHGVKENLVAKCSQWPGANCIRHLLHDEPLVGAWVDRSSLYSANRNLERPAERDFERRVEIKLTRLPCFSSLSEAEHRKQIRAIIDAVQIVAAKKRRREGRRVLGVKKVCRQNPLGRPKQVTRRPAPKCHASDIEHWRQHVIEYRSFEQRYRSAAARWKSGSPTPDYPPGSFLPGGHFMENPERPPPAQLAA